MKKYEQIDISGDVGLRVWGGSMEELFMNAAEGMFNLITDTSVMKETEGKEITVEAGSAEDLLINWLNELVFLFDTYGFVGKTFSVVQDNNKLTAKISGGIFNPDVNESRLLIKAATYHRLSLKNNNSGWEAVVIFDI